MWKPVAVLCGWSQFALPAQPDTTAAFDYQQRIGVARWSGSQGCLAIANDSIAPGARVVLVQQHLGDQQPAIFEAVIAARAPKACDEGLPAADDGGAPSSFHVLDAPGAPKPAPGILFAVINPPHHFNVREEHVETELSTDIPGLRESFSLCTGAETVHLLVWTGSAQQGALRWHGTYHLNHDVEPSCTEREIKHIESLQRSLAAARLPLLEPR